MTDFAQKYRTDLDKFFEQTDAFYKGELKVPEYKHFSGGYGSYAQRGAKASMLRLRTTGGRISKEMLSFIVNVVKKYQVDRLHITTCQAMQLHNLSCDTVKAVMEESWQEGYFTKGGGGDYPRNVMASPLAGVQKGEYFDITPYAQAVAEYTRSLFYTVKLPRKLKICFSNSAENEPHATFRDLGFVARADQKFDVYCAGGLGRAPRLGVKVGDGIEPKHVLYYVQAMVEVFTENGDYQNRGKSRTRFLQETLGPDVLKEKIEEKVWALRQKGQLDLNIQPTEIRKHGEGEPLYDARSLKQKQEGLYAVSYHPLGGNLTPEKIEEIYETIEEMDDVEIRLTPDAGMYIINCNANEARKVLAATSDDENIAFAHSVACIGNSICQVGARDSQALLQECFDAVKQAGFSREVLPAIHISGCPSSCGSHQTNILGFRGGVKQTDDGPKPAFALFIGGNAKQGAEVISEEAGVILQEQIPSYLVELGKAVEQTELSFEEWIVQYEEQFHQITEKYTK
ncbi:MAG: nitrite/sulfite reductase [Lachnospiraceae bacterium]